MRLKIGLAIGLAALFTLCANAQAAWTEEQIREILIERIDVQTKSKGIAVGYWDGEQALVVGYGAFSDEDGRVPDGKTLMEIGSITKVFTAVLLADMVRRGEVGLHDPVQKYLPEGVHLSTWEGEPITLYHLTTHTSGLPRLPNNMSPDDPTNPYADYSVRQMYEFIGEAKLLTRPGETQLYSNLGVGLLGHVLALRAGMDYEALVTERIIAPLGMDDTVVTLAGELASRMAQGHNEALQPTSNWDIPTLAGAGALRSTVDDMLIFLKANLQSRESSILPTLQDTHETYVAEGDSKRPMGWAVYANAKQRVHWHNGGTGGFRTMAGFDLGAGTAVVVLSNTAISADDIALHLVNPEARLKTFKTDKEAVEISDEQFDRLVGSYAIRPEFVLKFWRDGDKYWTQATGQSALRIYPESETRFYLTAVEASIEFLINDAGEVDRLVLRQGGRNSPAQRIED